MNHSHAGKLPCLFLYRFYHFLLHFWPQCAHFTSAHTHTGAVFSVRVVRALINRIKNCNFIVIYLNHRPIIHARGSAEALRQQSSASKSPPPAVRRSSGQCKWMCKFSLQPSVCVCVCVCLQEPKIYSRQGIIFANHTHTFTNQMIPFGCPRLVPHNTTNKLKLHTWHYWPCQCMCVCVWMNLFFVNNFGEGGKKTESI